MLLRKHYAAVFVLTIFLHITKALRRNIGLSVNGRPLHPADLSNFYASMKLVQI